MRNLTSRGTQVVESNCNKVVIIIIPPFFLDVTLSILGNFKLNVTLLFWVITSLYLSPITCSHGTLLFFILSISLLSKNYLGVRDLKSVTFKKKRRKYKFLRFSFDKVQKVSSILYFYVSLISIVLKFRKNLC